MSTTAIRPAAIGGPSYSRVLACRPEAASAARRLVSAALETWRIGELRGDAEQIASELATNAVLHAGVQKIREAVRRYMDAVGLAYAALDFIVRPDRAWVVSADIDPALTSAAADALARLGHTPQLRAVDAMAEEWGCAFDRIIASCALPRISGSLRRAVREDGRLIVNLFPPLNNTLVVLDRQPNGCLEGRFHGDGGSFMAARTGSHLKAGNSEGSGYSSGTTSVPQAAFDSYHFQFLLAAHLPGAELQYGSEGAATMRRLVLPSGDWAEVTYDGSKSPTWSEVGGQGVWETVERWWKWFNDHDQPTWDRFGLTVTPEDAHLLWFENPTGSDVWALV